MLEPKKTIRIENQHEWQECSQTAARFADARC
jgi:hypothetical protein